MPLILFVYLLTYLCHSGKFRRKFKKRGLESFNKNFVNFLFIENFVTHLYFVLDKFVHDCVSECSDVLKSLWKEYFTVLSHGLGLA